jgi:hypothetical protein
MLKLVIAKILLLLAIMVYCLAAYHGFALPFGLIGSGLLFAASQIIEWQIPSLREPSYRDAIFNFVIFIILFRLGMNLKRLGLDINELIFKDPSTLLTIFICSVVHSSFDLFYKGKKIRCREAKETFKS